MQNTTADYKLEINKPSRSFECKITIGNNIYTNEDLVNLTLEYTQPQEGFAIGNTISQSLDLTLLNRGDIIYSTSQIKVEIGLKIAAKIEYILMGIFNIDDIEKTDYTTKFTAYDNMIKFETDYFSELGDKPTLKQVVNELSSKTGVEFTGSLPDYNVSKLEGFSCREVLSYVASICGGNAFITREGKFTIKSLSEVEKSIDGNNYFDYTREEVKYKVGQISCQVDENNILSKGSTGTDSMELGFENPWISETILTEIYNKLKSVEYLGYSMKWQGDISLDPYDIITVTDVKNVVRKIPILSQKLSYTGGLTSEIGAKGETKNKNSFSSSGSTTNKVNRAVIEQAIIKEALIGKANIEDVEAVSIRTQTLEAKTAKIEDAIIDVAHIKDLNAINANIQNLIAADATINNALIGKADITELNAVKGTINSLDSKIANIETLVNGNLSSENIQAGGITSDKLTIANGFITNAMIASLDVAKINAGDISTNKFRIVSDNGGIEIVGATQQFKDKNNKVRIQMGQDATGNFNFILRGEDGTTTLIDHTGIKEKAIADNLIKENMVAADAIGEKQINYSSLITGLNKDTNTQLIKASKVAIDLTGQSLEVAFNSLKSNVDNMEIGTENLFLNADFRNGKNNWAGSHGATIEVIDNPTSEVLPIPAKKVMKLTGATGQSYGFITQTIACELYTEYTVSFWCYFPNTVPEGLARIMVYYNNSGWKGLNGKTITERNKWVKKSLTFKSDKTFNNLILALGFNGSETPSKVCYCCLAKIEKGNKATDFTLSSADIDSSIESVKQITESNSTTINVMQGQIATAINNTQIVKDGQTILLKDDYNRTVATVNSINSTIGTHTTKLNELTGSISSVDTKINSVQRDLEGTKSTVSSHTSQINGLNSTVGTQGSSINQLKNEISLKVEQTDINNAVTSLKIGGDNILRNGNFAYSMSDWSVHDMSSGGTSKSVDVENGGGDWKPANKKVLVIRGTNTTNRYGVISSTIKLIPKTKYTISGYCAGHRVNKIQVNVRDRQGSDANIHTIDINPVSGGSTLDKWCRFETTFTTTSNTDFALNLYSVNFADNGYVWFCDVQIQQGTKASAWIPCSADIDNSISNVQTQVTTTNNKVASIETNLNGITQRVSSTESTISTHTTQLGTVDNRINTAKNAAISAAATDATSKANNAQSKALADAKSYTNGQITTVNKTITDKVAEIKTTTDSITQRVSSTESTTSTLTTKVNTAQSTADSKAKVFTSTPTVPYKVGDLWTGGPSGDVMRCKVARTSGNYTASDWEKASKYTDDTKANAAQSTANTANATANANKTEITSTKNKVSTIETNLNSITSKVSSAEKNITTINGNITSLQNRMSSAEQKITSSAIISTVQSTINTAKNEAINSANSSTDNKLKSYATTSSLTQTANNITASFKSSGGFNLLKNSDAKNGSSYWVSNGGGLSITTAGINPFIGEKEFKTTFPSGMAYYTSVRLKSNTDYVYEAWIYTNTAITSNSLTPLHFWCSSTADTSGQSQCTVIDYRQTLTVNAYTKVYVHFRTKSGNVFFKPFIYSSATSGMICVKQISLSEGTIESAWTPHPDEVYSGSTMIDANGVTINNGALTVKNKSGSTVLSGDSNGNLNLYAVGSKFKFTATGQRVTEMYSDASGNGDVFTIKVPFYNKDSGFRLCTDTGVNLIEAYAKNGDVHRLKLHGFQTDNIKATYMVASKQLYRYDDSGIYWKPIYTRNENAGIKMIDKLGIVNKSSGGLYMQVDMDGGGAYGIDIWSSDINLKKNIRELNSKIKPLSLQEDTITGLELIKKIKHYEFDYDETKGFEGHIDCGYISQQLQEINSSFVTEVEQEDGTILLQPLASALLPHMSKAIQEQQEKIEELEKIILELKSKIGA